MTQVASDLLTPDEIIAMVKACREFSQGSYGVI